MTAVNKSGWQNVALELLAKIKKGEVSANPEVLRGAVDQMGIKATPDEQRAFRNTADAIEAGFSPASTFTLAE